MFYNRLVKLNKNKTEKYTLKYKCKNMTLD